MPLIEILFLWFSLMFNYFTVFIVWVPKKKLFGYRSDQCSSFGPLLVIFYFIILIIRVISYISNWYEYYWVYCRVWIIVFCKAELVCLLIDVFFRFYNFLNFIFEVNTSLIIQNIKSLWSFFKFFEQLVCKKLPGMDWINHEELFFRRSVVTLAITEVAQTARKVASVLSWDN